MSNTPTFDFHFTQQDLNDIHDMGSAVQNPLIGYGEKSITVVRPGVYVAHLPLTKMNVRAVEIIQDRLSTMRERATRIELVSPVWKTGA